MVKKEFRIERLQSGGLITNYYCTSKCGHCLYACRSTFSEAERDWTRKVKGQIENLAAKPGRQIEVVWPYELITQKEIDELGESANQEIFHRCKSRCNRARHNISLNS